MTTQEVANRFHELAQSGNWEGIQTELYADNAKSIEPEHSPGMQSVEGMDAIREQGKKFGEMVEEMHGGYTNAPIVAGMLRLSRNKTSTHLHPWKRHRSRAYSFPSDAQFESSG